MPAEVFDVSVVIILALNLAALLVIFDTIKRTKGKFNLGWKVLFFAVSLFFIKEIMDDIVLPAQSGLVEEVIEIVFISVLLITVIIINRKVRETGNHTKKGDKR